MSWHSLLTCDMAKRCWEMLNLWDTIQAQLVLRESLRVLFFYLLATLDRSMQTTFAMTLWSLWGSRSSKLWDGVDETSAAVVHRGHSMFHAWHKVRLHLDLEVQDVQAHPSTVAARHRPPVGYYKCNIDARFDHASGKTRVGICIRDCVARFVMSRAAFVPQSHDGSGG